MTKEIFGKLSHFADAINEIFYRNGWEPAYSNYDTDQYGFVTHELTFGPSVRCRACVSCTSKGYEFIEQLGVGAITIVSVDGKANFVNPDEGLSTMGILDHINAALEMAEENLLLIGVPFTNEYGFHGRKPREKSRRNKTLRRAYALDELEEKLMEEELDN